MSLHIREAVRSDASQILAFITELAIYEKAEHEVVATVADIEQSLFEGATPAHALICELDGQPIGFAVYFYSYSTWLGRKGMYLEDLYVSRSNAAWAPARPCCATSRAWPATVAAAAWSGACWTGTARHPVLPLHRRQPPGRMGALPHGRGRTQGIRPRGPLSLTALRHWRGKGQRHSRIGQPACSACSRRAGSGLTTRGLLTCFSSGKSLRESE